MCTFIFVKLINAKTIMRLNLKGKYKILIDKVLFDIKKLSISIAMVTPSNK